MTGPFWKSCCKSQSHNNITNEWNQEHCGGCSDNSSAQHRNGPTALSSLWHKRMLSTKENAEPSICSLPKGEPFSSALKLRLWWIKFFMGSLVRNKSAWVFFFFFNQTVSQISGQSYFYLGKEKKKMWCDGGFKLVWWTKHGAHSSDPSKNRSVLSW